MNHAIPLALVRTAIQAKSIQVSRQIHWPTRYGIAALTGLRHCHWINHRLAYAPVGRSH